MRAALALTLLVTIVPSSAVSNQCPFQTKEKKDFLVHLNGGPMNNENSQRLDDYLEALDKIDFGEVRQAINKMLTDSQNFWPADYGTYAGLFIRLAWHSAGSYRISDGRGGVDGARMRFDPERNWADDTNLDKARTLLWPIKKRFGKGLSWGDLFALTGDMSIQESGGPVLGFCAGRFDDVNGAASELLGPTAEQKELFPCKPGDGLCEAPLGQNTLGLIYVNPEGPLGVPDPVASIPETRSTFARMGMNDSETVALIGGGHTLGKTHGSCPKGAGPGPDEDPANPWPGLCGTGKGQDAFTSGFEGPWVSTPTVWQNEYFYNLLDFEWRKKIGPGGHWQWYPWKGNLVAPAAFGKGTQDVMMLTTDVGLTFDTIYKKYLNKYRSDLDSFNHDFSHAWYKLMTRDMGPYQRCRGDAVPPPQPFQFPLPDPNYGNLADFQEVATAIRTLMATSPEVYPEAFARLASQCSGSFRETDYQGGCNGAFIRFEPAQSYSSNEGSAATLEVLASIKEQFGDGLSWADLMVIAGTTSVVSSGALPMEFCGGRTDGSINQEQPELEPLWSFSSTDLTGTELKHFGAAQVGLTNREFVAITGYRSVGQKGLNERERDRPRTATPKVLDNSYFQNILDLDYQLHEKGMPSAYGEGENENSSQGGKQSNVWYRAALKEAPGGFVYALTGDLQLKWDPELKAITQEFAADNDVFLEEFQSAWKKYNNLDRFWLPRPPASACIMIQ